MVSMGTLSETSKNEFYIKVSKRNLIIEIIILTLLCIYELNALVSSVLHISVNALNITIKTYFLIHISLFTLYIIILSLCLIFKKTLCTKRLIINIYTFVLAYFICLWSLFITLISYHEITLYIATLLTIGFVVTLTPKKSVYLFSSIHLIFITMFFLFGGNNFNSNTVIFDTTILMIVSMIISYINYQNRIREFIQLATITEQNISLKLTVMKDSLTELFNRHCFDKTMQSLLNICIVKKIKLSVLMLDIDDFKRYNDSFGHQAGDICLIEVSRILKNATNTNSGLAFRYGGEEFTIIYIGLDKNEVMNKAEFVRKEVEMLTHPFNPTISNITISTGIFHVLPNENTDFNHCIKVADALLYKVKDLGKNRILFKEEFN